MSNETTLTYIKTLTKPFPQDDDLCKQFIEKSRWDSYKREVVEKVVSEQQKNVGFHEMLRSSKRSDYLHSLQEDATLQDWLSRSKATASSSFYGTGPTAQVTGRKRAEFIWGNTKMYLGCQNHVKLLSPSV